MPTARYDTTSDLPQDLRATLRAITDAATRERAHRAEAAAVAGRLRATVQEARTAGASWTLIARAAGTTRGGAEKRFGADRII